jgi:hypothetical protein
MSLIVSDQGGGGDFTPHPEGQYVARCIDVVDLGWMGSDFGPKYKIRVVLYCGETTEREIEGEKKKIPLLVMEMFTASLNEKANLRKFLESWRGLSFTPEEAKGFDMEKMIGAPAFVQIKHSVGKNGKTYANVSSIMRMPKSMTPPPLPEDFVRVCDRPDWAGPAPHPDMSPAAPPAEPPTEAYHGPEDEDDGLPF